MPTQVVRPNATAPQSKYDNQVMAMLHYMTLATTHHLVDAASL
jgi:hypothetical protein